MLSKILKEGGLSKTKLTLYAYLNYQRAVKYLHYLQEAGLVQIDKEVKITRRGLETLEKIEEVLRGLGLGG
ncbi:hypothetical protein Pogu_1668 [Pyrobaculum oguniense TE7]|uniref:ArnR1-like winged helix-turn-helix domain-containing protein n=1 Tax=Pyrobaculum oguniense (strain DSM 13380 / JCM 10595 / TE7) TaxID=698757 RepID=H6QAR9_PYROT|nr:hypothetical protein Pogu_1668 [Pyrobaculum oguniense TE7]